MVKYCWFAMQHTDYGKPLNKFTCNMTKERCKLCTDKDKTEKCETRKKWQGHIVAL